MAGFAERAFRLKINGSHLDRCDTTRSAARWLGATDLSNSCRSTTARIRPADLRCFSKYRTRLTAFSAIKAWDWLDPPFRWRARTRGRYSMRKPAARARAA